VYTVDQSHSEGDAVAGRHLQHTIGDGLKLESALKSRWGDKVFKIVLIDFVWMFSA